MSRCAFCRCHSTLSASNASFALMGRARLLAGASSTWYTSKADVHELLYLRHAEQVEGL